MAERARREVAELERRLKGERAATRSALETLRVELADRAEQLHFEATREKGVLKNSKKAQAAVAEAAAAEVAKTAEALKAEVRKQVFERVLNEKE